MRKLIKKSSIFAAYFLLPLSLIATDTSYSDFCNSQEAIPTELDQNLFTRHSSKKNNKNKTKKNSFARSLLITGESFDFVRNSGAFFSQSFSDQLRIPSIVLPSVSNLPTQPTASIGFRIPSDFNSKLKSTIKVQFITASSQLLFEGNASLVLHVDAAKPNETLIGGTPIPATELGLTVNSVQNAPFNTAANYYMANFKINKVFNPGEFVYLTITRDNGTLDNFGSEIFIVGLELDYNR